METGDTGKTDDAPSAQSKENMIPAKKQVQA